MKYVFQHFMDISTSANSMNIITVKAGGKYVFQRCKHLFGAYKYFKLGKVKIKLLPAATLPVDPLMMGYGSEEVPVQVDPRDQMNPGLVRITNGENICNNITGVSAEVQNQMYTNTMLDPRWSKFMLQRGFSRTAVPLFWDVGMDAQEQYPDSKKLLPLTKNTDGELSINGEIQKFEAYNDDASKSNIVAKDTNISPGNLIQLGHKVRMGWLPTDGFENIVYQTVGRSQTPVNARIPSVELITIVLPKAYKTLFHYRLFITEEVFFSGIKNVGLYKDGLGGEVVAIDNFNRVGFPTPEKPYDSLPPTSVPIQNYPYGN